MSLARVKVFSRCGLVLVGFLIILGIFRAYSRGANDFSVFYEAWRLVLTGRGAEIYRVSPDRYLYSPGFAWLLSPLGLLSKNVSLAAWCFIKMGLIGFLLKKLSHVWLLNMKMQVLPLG